MEMKFDYFKKKIQYLSQTCPDLNQIDWLMREFYIDKAISIVQAIPPFICRARINDTLEIFSRQEQLSYNPNKYEIQLRRANFPGQQVFYGSLPTRTEFANCQNTALLETIMEHVRDEKIMSKYLTLSRWTVRRPLNVCILPFSEESRVQNKDFEKANDNFTNYLNRGSWSLNEGKNQDYYDALFFMSTIFCQKDSKESCYKISAAYFNIIMEYTDANGMKLDGMIYPSANTGAAGMNIVLRKEVIDGKAAEFDYVVMMVMKRSRDNPKLITFDKVSDDQKPDEAGNFQFTIVPRLTT